MKEQKKQPELRFKGFTDDWEQRDLGDITEKIGSGKTPRGGSSSYSEKGVIFLRSQNIHSNKVDFSNIVYIDNHMDYEMANSRVQQGDVLLNITGASIGRSAVYNSNESANVNQHVCIIRPSDKISSEYIQLCLVSFDGQKKIEAYQAGGGREGLNFKQISEMTFIIPFENEQKQIGEFFQKLDHTITLQQRRLDLLKKLKQGYLQQMFPTKDEVIPQLRFNIFNGAWEQVKLSELVTKEKSYSLSRDVETEKETETRYIHYGDIHTGIADKITNKNQLPFIKEDSYEPLLKGDLILADASEDYQGIATPAIILETTKYRIVAGLHTIVLRPSDKCDSLYLYYLLKTKSFKRHGYRMGTGMKVFGITANNVLAFKTLLPSKKEQNKISQLLKIMDRLLALQQSKIKQLQQLKQAYLQKLFP